MNVIYYNILLSIWKTEILTMKYVSKDKNLEDLPFLLTSSSLRLIRFAMDAGNVVKSLSGKLSLCRD